MIKESEKLNKFLVCCAIVFAALPAAAQTGPSADPAEVNQSVANQIGQLVIQLAQAQAVISAQAKEIAKLNAQQKSNASPAKK